MENSYLNPMLKFLQIDLLDVGMIVIGCAAIFILWRLLEGVFFRPFLEMTDLRESKTVGEIEKARELLRDTEALRAGYEERMFELRASLAREEDAQIASVQAEAASIIQAAEQQAKQLVERARTDIRRAVDGALAQRESQAERLAHEMLDKLAAH